MGIQNEPRQNLKTMMVMRQFEHDIKELANQGFVEGAVHCYTGEEAIDVAIEAIRKLIARDKAEGKL